MTSSNSNWAADFTRAICNHKQFPALSSESMDMVLSWLSGSESGSPGQLSREMNKSFSNEKEARHTTLRLLDEHLFGMNSSSPFRQLGLSRYTTKADARIRYRRLMLIYHPDRDMLDETLLNTRARQINGAFASIQNMSEAEFRQTPKTENIKNVSPGHSVKNQRMHFSREVKKPSLRSLIGPSRNVDRKLYVVLLAIAGFVLAMTYLSSMQ